MDGASKAAREPLRLHDYNQEKVREFREGAMELRNQARYLNKLAEMLDDLSLLVDIGQEKTKDQTHSSAGLDLRS